MFDVFENYITTRATLTADELQFIRALSVERTYRRREVVLQEGELCPYKMFITKGLLKTSALKEDGSESVLRFAAENMWTTDHDIYNTQTPSAVQIEALEDTEAVCWTRDNIRELQRSIPAFQTYV